MDGCTVDPMPILTGQPARSQGGPGLKLPVGVDPDGKKRGKGKRKALPGIYFFTGNSAPRCLISYES
jgi:hypothetical protein